MIPAKTFNSFVTLINANYSTGAKKSKLGETESSKWFQRVILVCKGCSVCETRHHPQKVWK